MFGVLPHESRHVGRRSEAYCADDPSAALAADCAMLICPTNYGEIRYFGPHGATVLRATTRRSGRLACRHHHTEIRRQWQR